MSCFESPIQSPVQLPVQSPIVSRSGAKGRSLRLLPTALVCGALLVGCGAASHRAETSPVMGDQVASVEAEVAQSKAASSQGQGGVAPDASAAGTAAEATPVATPQLIKRANLTLEVEDAIAAVKTIQQLVQQQQGDILNLQESTLPGDGSPRRAEIQLRVPQARLDATLDELANLGKVENRAITAEDVSSQLVDLSARLRNLRKQEEMTLGIMERSGEISQVLEVSNQLANVRQSIEQLDAQLQHLKTQVAYSTIQLSLAEPLAAAAARTSLGNEMKAAWQSATGSVGSFTRGLMVLGLWLLAYSPYLGAIAAAIYLGRRLRRRSA